MESFTIRGDFFDHPKTKMLKAAYGKRGVHALMTLWASTAEKHPDDGVWRNATAEDITRAASWRRDPQEFVDALCRIGFLDRLPDGYAIHDWKEHQGLP